MLEFLFKHKIAVRAAGALIIFALVYGSAVFSAEIFGNADVYFYTSSTIVQGFLALVALLGAIAVFKLQIEGEIMQKLADAIEPIVFRYKGEEALGYTQSEMLGAGKNILNENKPSEELNAEEAGEEHRRLLRLCNKMQQLLANRSEARKSLLYFVAISLFNVVPSLFMLVFAPVFVEHWAVGSFVLLFNVLFSMYCLYAAFRAVRLMIRSDF